jgi:hypothetical protein
MNPLDRFAEMLHKFGFQAIQKYGAWGDDMLFATRETPKGTERMYVQLNSPWLKLPVENMRYGWTWQCDGFGTNSGMGHYSMVEFLKEAK